MKGIVAIVVLGAIIPLCLGSSLPHKKSALELEEENEESVYPPNYKDYPEGYWFGTQNLFCVMGVTGSPSSTGRKRRDLKYPHPSRYSLRFAHRILYYKGMMYEWGTGTMGYFMGDSPSVIDCPITWEALPTGNSTCSTQNVRHFTYDYRSNYGVYNLATNNCHHFANRASRMLSSSTCRVMPAPWSQYSRKFWRYLGGWFTQRTSNPIRFNDIVNYHDRTNIH